MKLSVMQENLARGLSVVSRAVSSRSTLPVLSNVLLRTEDAGLKLTATNLEIGITSWVPGKIDEEGALTVPARLLTDVVAGLPPGERVELTVETGNSLHVKAGRYQTHLRGIDAEEFPVIPSAGDRPTTRLEQRALRRALGEVAFAAATDEARPILTGVLTKISGDRLTLAAADNYRIAVKTLPVLSPTEETTFVVPARSYQELMRILGDTDDPVERDAGPGQEPGDLQRRGHGAGQPPDRRAVPQLPAGAADQPRQPGRRRAGGSPQGRAPLGADRQHGRQRGQAEGRRGRQRRDHHRGQLRLGRRRGRGGGAAGGRRRDDRLQRALPDRGAPEPRRRPAGPGVQRPALAGRAQAGRTTRTTSTSSCRSAPRPEVRREPRRPSRRPGPAPVAARLPQLPGARDRLRRRPAAGGRAQRRRQDQPDRGARRAVAGPLPPDQHGCRDGRLGRAVRPPGGRPRDAAGGRGRPPEVVLVAPGSAAGGGGAQARQGQRRAAAAVGARVGPARGALRPGGHAARRRLARAAALGARPADGPARPGPPQACPRTRGRWRSATRCCAGSARSRRPATSCPTGTA